MVSRGLCYCVLPSEMVDTAPDDVPRGEALPLFVILLYAADLRTGWATLPVWFLTAFGIWLRPDAIQTLWRGLAVVLLLDTVDGYYYVANHQFLSLYIAGAGAFSRQVVRRLAIPVVAGVLLISGAQKAFSPDFVSGLYLEYLASAGRLAKWMLAFNPGASEVAAQNLDALEQLSSTPPAAGGVVVLKPVVAWVPRAVWQVVSVALVVGECGVAAALLLRPGRPPTHMAALALLWGIALVREETGFLALMAALLSSACAPSDKFRGVYAVSALAFSAAVLSGIGYS